jgi:cytochrome c2
MRLGTSNAIVCVSSVFATLFFGSQVSYGETLAARQQDFAMCARCHPISTRATNPKKSLRGIVRRRGGGAIRYWYSAVTVTANFTQHDVTLDKFVAGRADFVPVKSMSITRNGSDRQDLIAYRDTPEWSVPQHLAVPQGKEYHSPSLHRLSRGCGFHYSDIQHGLPC